MNLIQIFKTYLNISIKVILTQRNLTLIKLTQLEEEKLLIALAKRIGKNHRITKFSLR